MQSAGPPADNEDNRIYKLLNVCRGIAALSVVVFHATMILVNRYPDLRDFPVYMIGAFGFLGVQMFFVVSGYCIAAAAAASLARGRSTGDFLLARARRIFPAYWCSLAFYIPAALLMAMLVARGRVHASGMADVNIFHQRIGFYLAHLVLLQQGLRYPALSVVYWTLCYEAAFYALVAVCLAIAQRFGRLRVLLSCAHVVTVVTLLLPWIAPRWWVYPFDMWAQFGLGVLVYDLLADPRQNAPKAWAGVIAAQIVGLIASHGIARGITPQANELTYGVSLGIAALLWFLHRYDARLSATKPARMLAATGLFSYSLYLIHFLFLGLFSQGIALLHLPVRLHLLWFAGAMGLAITSGRMFYMFCEKPFTRRKRVLPDVETAEALALQSA